MEYVRKALPSSELRSMRRARAGARAQTDLLDPRGGGAFLIGAACLFWLAWFLMPGVGITDAGEILQRVAADRGAVELSVVLQLTSAACYAPALVALALRAHRERARGVLWAATFLIAGAMGSAADSVFHWLAVEMTGPGVLTAAMLPVMARMQGPALLAVAPLIAAFLGGTIALAITAARARWVAPPCAVVACVAPLTIPGGLAVAPEAGRITGLVFLACIAGVQAWVGLGLRRRSD